MNISEKIMNEAIDLSREKMEANEGGPFAALVVKDGKIVGIGWNQVTSTNDPTAHAEVVAIRDACKNLETFNLSDCELFTSCEPCPMCLGAIQWARISRVLYANTARDAKEIAGFDDEAFYEEFRKDPQNRKIKFEQIGRDKAIKVFEKWRDKSDKIEY